MIKSVLQAIPSYVMSVYLIPDSIISEIERMLNSFWWGDGSNNKGIRWLAWEKLTRPKAVGGLGYRDFHEFNMSLIAKQAWKFLSEPDKFVSRIFKARYFPRSSFFHAKIGDNPSFVWRSIWKSRDILVNGCRWKIGDGSKIKVVCEPWLRGGDNLWMQAPQSQCTYELHVNDLLLPGVKNWDRHKIHSLFPVTVAENIINTPLFEEVKEDKLVWIHENNGNYTVKSGYRNYIKSKAVEGLSQVDGAWSSIWRVAAPPKIKHLLWRICRGCLPTRVRLRGRHVSCPSECPFCNNSEEDDWHILFGCSESQQVWIEAGLRDVIMPRIIAAIDVNYVIFDVCRNVDEFTVGKFAMAMWCIWHNRNNWIWNGVKDSAKDVATRAAHMLAEWCAVNTVQQNSSFQSIAAVTTAAVPTDFDSSRDLHDSRMLRWEKPRDGWWKCNVDASFSQSPCYTGWGWCM
jgi:hypothetical protein